MFHIPESAFVLVMNASVYVIFMRKWFILKQYSAAQKSNRFSTGFKFYVCVVPVCLRNTTMVQKVEYSC